MRFFLSTVAAAALMTAPAMAQTADTGVGAGYDQQQQLGAAQAPGVEGATGLSGSGGLQHELSDAGFHDAQQMRNAEVFHSTYQGQPAIVVLLEEGAGIGLGADRGDPAMGTGPDVTGTIDQQPDARDVTGDVQQRGADQELGADATGAADQQLGAADQEFDTQVTGPEQQLGAADTGAIGDEQQLGAADTGAIGEDQQLGMADQDPATTGTIDQQQADASPAGEQDFGDPATTGTIDQQPGQQVGAMDGQFQFEQELGQAGFQQLQQAQGGEVIRTTTEDGRTMLIIVAQDFGAGFGAEGGVDTGVGDTQLPQ